MRTLFCFLLLASYFHSLAQNVGIGLTSALEGHLHVAKNDSGIAVLQNTSAFTDSTKSLLVNGAIEVSGPNKAAFQINTVTPAGNSNYFQVTSGTTTDYHRINSTLVENDPNAIIVATPVSLRLSYPFWIGYDASNTIGGGAGQWYIAAPRDGNGVGGFTNGMRFNIMTMKQ